MAVDLSDVTNALVDLLTQQYFASTPDPRVPSPSTLPSAVPMRVYRGSPTPGDLDADLPQGVVHVTVRPEPGMTRTMPRFSDWATVSKVPITVTANAVASAVTFAGTGTAGQVVGVGYAESGNSFQTGWSVRLSNGMAGSDIAAAFAEIIPGASANGAQLNLETDHEVMTGVVSDTTVSRIIKGVGQTFRIDTYCGDPWVRDEVCSVLPSLIVTTRSIPLPENCVAQNLRLGPTWEDDQKQKVGVWDRTQRIEVEYPITETAVQPGILHFGVNSGEQHFGRISPDV